MAGVRVRAAEDLKGDDLGGYASHGGSSVLRLRVNSLTDWAMVEGVLQSVR